MRKSNLMNMTEGRPMRLLFVFALPLLIGNLFQQAYNLADSMIVGKLLGANSLAAVGATGSISFLFFSVCNGISSGGGIITAQYYGAKDYDRVKRAIVNSAYIMLSTSLVTGITAFLMVPAVLGWMGTPVEILPDAITYMRMTSASVPLIAIYNYASSMQRALGDSRTPLYFLIFSCFVNVGLDLLFVGTFGLGVFGAALATMLSQLLAGVGSLLYAIRTNPFFRLNKSYLPFDRKIAKGAIRMGLPLALQWSLIAVSTTALQAFTNSFGANAVAAFTATNRLEQLVQQPFGSLSMALSTYSSQNYGANRKDRIRAGFRDNLMATVALSVLMFLLMQVWGDNLISLFVNETDVISLGGRALKITSFFYLFLGIIYATRGVLNGIGDALFAFINGFVEIAGRIGLPILLSMIPGVGVWAIWYTAGITWMLAGLSCVLRYFAWRRKNAVPRASF
uniref:Multidrug-efflux transporter n=1 Tax=uncultured bacterium Contig1468_n_1482_cl TaxID=1393431 RepID=W0FTY4_9BACT|nr:MATE efflux family protein [uncultured bacterium Contig1468_n_1482_cl]